jgi:ubiquinone/menaquinone biosynthesis C-methylase UbiE
MFGWRREPSKPTRTGSERLTRVSGNPAFRPDLYRGTASFYDQFRLPYPAALIDDLCRRASVSGTGRLVDLACGPGTATFALSDHFAEVWAVDQEPEAIEFAERKAVARGVRHVRWMAGRAEDVDPDEIFDLVTIGTAFHRLDRRRVADLAFRWLRSGGHLALLWNDTPLNGAAPWQHTYTDIVVDWMQKVGTVDRVPADLEAHIAQQPHTTVLHDAGFEIVGKFEFVEIHDWTVEALIGMVYSTTLLPLAELNDRADAFEADLRERLLSIEPSGIFREHASFAYDLARRPAR